MKRLICWALALLLLVSSCLAEDSRAELTLLIYMCGSDLESAHAAASKDLKEITSAAIPRGTVNVLIMTGGSSGWANGIPSDKLSVYMPGRGSLRMVAAFESASMGDYATLATFLKYGYENYPAKKYALILWDHGAGPLPGVCRDEVYGNDMLTLAELTAALESSAFAEEPLEWIGFDACLMGAAEVASAVSPYAAYMIASEETEPSTGWNYALLNGIADDASGAETGRRIIDLYFSDSASGGNRTLSCIDLSMMKAVEEAMDSLFSEVEITGGNYASYAYDIRKTEAFGKSVDSANNSDLIDLLTFAARLADEYPDESAALEQVMRSCVVYSRSDNELSTGLSVYHPFNNKLSYLGGWQGAYSALGFSEGYTRYTERFTGYLFGDTGLSWEGISARNTDSDGIFALPLTELQSEAIIGAEIALLEFAAETAAYRLLSSSNAIVNEAGTLYGAVGGYSLSLMDGDESAAENIPYTILADGSIAVYVNMLAPETDAAEANSSAAGMLTRGPFDTYNVGQSGTDNTAVSLDEGTKAEVNTIEYEVVTPRTDNTAISLSDGVLSSVGGLAGMAIASAQQSLKPPSVTQYTVVPVQSGVDDSSVSLSEGIVFGTLEELKYLQSIDIDKLSESERVIDMEAVEANAGEEIVYALIILDADGTELSIREIQVYDSAGNSMTTRSAVDLGSYARWAIPCEWKVPTQTDGTINAFGEWETVSSDVTVLDAPKEPVFRFTEGGAVTSGDKCVMFSVTDIQNYTHSTVPIYVK